jgi:3-isopropylmalate/(R)-2-methylmalate dehydratase small subunit
MREFSHLDAIAAPLFEANVDTDQILAGRFLKTVKREGLGKSLFYGMRFDDHGRERPAFILNRSPWREAGILIALENFGCGSSREHAPWALSDFGIRAIIAPSFADIFRNNCYKNGILPISLPADVVHRLIDEASDPDTAYMSIDLPNQTVRTALGQVIGFEISAENKEQLLQGLDEISGSEKLSQEIARFEAAKTYYSPPINLVT